MLSNFLWGVVRLSAVRLRSTAIEAHCKRFSLPFLANQKLLQRSLNNDHPRRSCRNRYQIKKHELRFHHSIFASLQHREASSALEVPGPLRQAESNDRGIFELRVWKALECR